MKCASTIYLQKLAMVTICLLLAGRAGAQIQIVPQNVVNEAATPTTIANVGIVVERDGVIELGNINEGADVIESEVWWSNQSGKPAAITRIRSGCGCLVADFRKRSVENGGRGSITLRFNPKGRSGSVNHKVYVYTNLCEDEPSAVIELRGEIVAKDGESALWPYAMGTLRLRTKQVERSNGKAVIAVRNTGTSALQISHDSTLTTRGITAKTEPRVLESGQEGNLVIEFGNIADGNVPLLLYIKGVDAPPRKRQIEIIEKQNNNK